MKKVGIVISLISAIFGLAVFDSSAQTFTSNSNFVAQPIPDRTVVYDVDDEGVSKPIKWGLDLAWLDETNIIRGMRFIGQYNVDVIRSSFMPTDPLVGEALQGDALTNTNIRIDIIKNNLGTAPDIVLNCDHPSVDPYFAGNAANWARLIDITRKMHEDAGLNVITVSPFNEPDLTSTGQGTIEDFFNICGELENNSNFANIRISGGNTLNPDFALTWYDYLKARLDEGNTHQLAGTFNNYASFFETVRANGHHATNDELHNIMEAMVGVEYGLQTGIWWGTAEYARGEFCKASDGVRLGYAEHRDKWTSAAVYRNTKGKVQAFGGTSERQAAASTYRFFSKDRPVFYDGYGPQYEYIMEMPGGEIGSYQNGQTNAERVVNITWGDDIQPVIDGTYILVNRNSGKVMEAANGNASNGTNIRQGPENGVSYQQWTVTPIDPENGGDFSYFNIIGVPSGKHIDISNFSLDNGGNALLWVEGVNWDGRQSLNQVWYLEYSGDGWFYIRNQNSSYCLEVASGSTADGANIQQYEFRGGKNQQWRFVPVGATIEFDAPAAPGELVATAKGESILLEWTASPDADVAGYTIYRSNTSGTSYNTIARNVTGTSFLDNSATDTDTYYYVVTAVDSCLNTSEYSNQVSAASTNETSLLARYSFERSMQDSSFNLNHGSLHGNANYVSGQMGEYAYQFNGTDAFVQLPPNMLNQDSISIAVWVYWRGGPILQKIFDFGNGEAERMYLTASTSLVGGKLQFGILYGEEEQVLETDLLPFKEWTHVAVTLDAGKARMYIDGELMDESNEFTLSPSVFKPVLNYVGRSQSADDPLFYGSLDELIIYNFALTQEEVLQVMNTGVIPLSNSIVSHSVEKLLSVWPVPAQDVLHIDFPYENYVVSSLEVFDLNGRMVLSGEMNSSEAELDISSLPGGIYTLRIFHSEGSKYGKFIVE